VNRNEAEATLRQIKYKPDHTLRWEWLTKDDVVEIYWEFERPDCYNPSEWGVGRSGPVIVFLPHVYTKEQLMRTVFGMTMRLEEHEAREWFLFGIHRPFDPHKQLLDRSYT
jgi:hypothetical protein